jgi:hypothetical protein
MSKWEICFDLRKTWQPVNDWKDIEAAIDRLDNEAHPYFKLSEDSVRYMNVFGGNQNRVVVEFLRVGKEFEKSILYDASQSTSIPIYSLRDAETWTYLPPSACVDKALAKRALRHFYETQTRLETLEWGKWPQPPIVWSLMRAENDKGQIVTEWAEIEATVDAMNITDRPFLNLQNSYDQGDRSIEAYSSVEFEDRVMLVFMDQSTEAIYFVLLDKTQTERITIYYSPIPEYWEDSGILGRSARCLWH